VHKQTTHTRARENEFIGNVMGFLGKISSLKVGNKNDWKKEE
jgi:hypothetical protein